MNRTSSLKLLICCCYSIASCICQGSTRFIILIHLLTESVARVVHYTMEPGEPFIFIASLLGMQIQIKVFKLCQIFVTQQLIIYKWFSPLNSNQNPTTCTMLPLNLLLGHNHKRCPHFCCSHYDYMCLASFPGLPHFLPSRICSIKYFSLIYIA